MLHHKHQRKSSRIFIAFLHRVHMLVLPQESVDNCLHMQIPAMTISNGNGISKVESFHLKKKKKKKKVFIWFIFTVICLKHISTMSLGIIRKSWIIFFNYISSWKIWPAPGLKIGTPNSSIWKFMETHGLFPAEPTVHRTWGSKRLQLSYLLNKWVNGSHQCY